jgi:hypothetical protein
MGTEVRHLKTADYTLAGLENWFAIERKKTASEFSQSLFAPRFERELCRLDSFEHPYLFLEFSWKEMLEFPRGGGIPPHKWKNLRVTSDLLVRKYHEMRLAHPTLRVEFVGPHGRDAASSLFKRIWERRPS